MWNKIKSFFSKERMKAVRYWLKLWDAVWSAPLSILIFTAISTFGYWYYRGPNDESSFAAYDPAFILAPLLAAIFAVIINFLAWRAIQFNFSGVYEFYLKTSKEVFNNLEPWQKIKLLVFLFCFFFAVIALFTLRLV